MFESRHDQKVKNKINAPAFWAAQGRKFVSGAIDKLNWTSYDLMEIII